MYTSTYYSGVTVGGSGGGGARGRVVVFQLLGRLIMMMQGPQCVWLPS
jgi:hypothetical protein